jgi:hypothetical protein
MTSRTLDQLRNWLAGETVDGLPYRELPKSADELEVHILKSKDKKRSVEDKRLTKVSRGRYEPLRDGEDAKLLFGRYSGRAVSSLASSRDKDEKSYLKWLLESDFPSSLKDIVRKHYKSR